MAKHAKRKKKRCAANGAGVAAAFAGTTTGAKRGVHNASQRILDMVTPEWPTLLANKRFQAVGVLDQGQPHAPGDAAESGGLRLGIPANLYEEMWKFYETLDDHAKLAALAVHDAGKVRMLETVTIRARHAMADDPQTAFEGMFLAIRAPGRDDTHHAALFRSWRSLTQHSAEFCQASQGTIVSESRLLANVRVYDAEQAASRSILSLDPAAVRFAREMLEGAVGEEIGMGRLAITDIRTGDEDDYNAITDPTKQQTRAYEKLPSSLFSGSIASALALHMLQSLYANCLAAQRARGHEVQSLNLCYTALAYLRDSLADYVATEEAQAALPETRRGAQVRALATSEDPSGALLELFSSPFEEWAGPSDEVLAMCAADLVAFHSQRVAEDLIDSLNREETPVKTSKRPADAASRKGVPSKVQGLEQAHCASRERADSASTAHGPGTDPANCSHSGESDAHTEEGETGPSATELTPSLNPDPLFEVGPRDAPSNEHDESASSDAWSTSGGENTQVADVASASAAETASAAGANARTDPSSEAVPVSTLIAIEREMARPDVDLGQWEQVPAYSRKARRNSLRQTTKQGDGGETAPPGQAGGVFGAAGLQKSTPTSAPPSCAGSPASSPFQTRIAPPPFSISDLPTGDGAHKSSGLPPTAPGPPTASQRSHGLATSPNELSGLAALLGGAVTSSGSSSTSLSSLTSRRRGESGETLSLSSANSSSTLYDDGQLTPSWPSKIALLASEARRRKLTPDGSYSPPSTLSALASAAAESGVEDEQLPGSALVGAPALAASCSSPVPGFPADMLRLLDHDIVEMSAMLEQIAVRRHPWQLAVSERIKSTVESMFPGATTTLFGSLATGLAAPCSDVDMVVQNLSQPGRTAMRALAERLKQASWVQMIQSVEHAAVPVIRLCTAQIPISFGNQGSLINVDITFDAAAHRGLRTASLVKALLAEYPPLKPLALVLKQFLVEKGLNDPFVGGLSSYGLVIMITAILQRHLPPPPGKPAPCLGSLLVLFLQEYAQPSFAERGVYIFRPGVESTEQRAAAKLEYANVLAAARPAMAPLYIVDPLDVTNNVGRTCFGIHQVVHAFSEALEAIQLTAVRSGHRVSPPEDWSILGSVFSTGHHRHVVQLVTQVWCPRENPVSIKPAMDIREWAITAKSVLETLEHKGRVCPWCSQAPHATACTLKSLLVTFPGLGV